MAVHKSLETISGMILNQQQQKFAVKTAANESYVWKPCKVLHWLGTHFVIGDLTSRATGKDKDLATCEGLALG